jgi:glycosyltransferase involved in cell wall biosynthesis
MNIWYICKYVSTPNRGYVGMRAFYLMQCLVKENCNIDLVTSSSSAFLTDQNVLGRTDIYSNFTFHQLSGIRYGKAGFFLRILSWLEFEFRVFFLNKKIFRKPDVVIASSLSILSIINGYIWSRRYKAKLVFEVRDIWPLTLSEEGGFSKRNPLVFVLSLLERWGYSVSDLIVGTMPNLQQHVSQVSSGSERKVVCIPFGYPDGQPDELFRSDFSIESNNTNFVLGYVGTVGHTNALDTLFRALNKMDLVANNIEVHIVGEGPLLDYYKQEYKSINNLYFRGGVDKRHVAEVMSSFDVLYFSTYKSKVWDFGQSLNKLVDYMLSGKPILASYSGFQTMINEAGCGWFLEAEDSDGLVEKVMEIAKMERKDLVTMGSKGRSWILSNRKYSVLARNYKNYLCSIQDSHSGDM